MNDENERKLGDLIVTDAPEWVSFSEEFEIATKKEIQRQLEKLAEEDMRDSEVFWKTVSNEVSSLMARSRVAYVMAKGAADIELHWHTDVSEDHPKMEKRVMLFGEILRSPDREHREKIINVLEVNLKRIKTEFRD